MNRIITPIKTLPFVFALVLAACGTSGGEATSTEASNASTESSTSSEPTASTTDSSGSVESEVDVESDTDCMTAVGNASIVCLQDATVIESNGLPDHEVMVGIEAGGWNGQWPTAQDYTGECGAYVSADGLIHYAFTDEYPYVTQCLLGAYEEGPRTSGAETDTGGYSSEELGSITGYEVRDDGCQVMTFASGIELVHCDDH